MIDRGLHTPQLVCQKKKMHLTIFFLLFFLRFFFPLILISRLNNPLLLNYSIYFVGCHAQDIHTHFATHAKWVVPQYSLMAQNCMNLFATLNLWWLTIHLIDPKHKQPSLTPLQTHLPRWCMGWFMGGTFLYNINICGSRGSGSRSNIDVTIRNMISC